MSEAGAVFGELSILLDQPHTADVCALEASEFHVADEALLAKDPLALTYVAMALAVRVNNANRAVIELKRQLDAREPHSVIVETVAEIDANLVYAGYPFNPFMYIERASDKRESMNWTPALSYAITVGKARLRLFRGRTGPALGRQLA